MSRRRGAIALVSASVLSGLSGPLAAQSPGGLDFRGIALGSTLTELRRTRFAEAAGALIICTHDPEATEVRPSAEFELSVDQLEAGIVVCGAFVFARPLGPTSTTLPAEWLPARISVGGIDMIPRYWFTVAGDGDDIEGRLYRITMHTNSANWEVVRSAFVARYGEPTGSGPVTSPAEFGKLDNVRLTWQAGGSTLTITKRLNLPNRLVVEFDLPGLKPDGG